MHSTSKEAESGSRCCLHSPSTGAAQPSAPWHRPPRKPSARSLTSLLFPSEKLGTHSTSLAIVPGSACTLQPHARLLVPVGLPGLSSPTAEKKPPSTQPVASSLSRGFSLTASISGQESERVLDKQHGTVPSVSGATLGIRVLPACQGQPSTLINHECQLIARRR